MNIKYTFAVQLKIIDMPKEKMIDHHLTIQATTLDDVKESAKTNSEGNVNREIRRLVKIGLESEKLKTK